MTLIKADWHLSTAVGTVSLGGSVRDINPKKVKLSKP